MTVFLSGDKVDAARLLQRRLGFILTLFLLVFTIIGIRCFQVALFPDEQHKPKERANSGELTYARADITDRNGQLLATSLKLSSLYADPSEITDKDGTANQLLEIFPDLNKEKLLKGLSQKNRFFWIKRHITPQQMARVNALGVPGLEFMEEFQRVYPQGALTSHIVGAVNVDGNGIEGTEHLLNDKLKDKKNTVKLALDMRLQNVLAEEIQGAMTHFEAIGGAGVIVDIPTGEILAAVSLPGYDPNKPGNPNDNSRFNRLTSGVYEMGSTFKIFSTAALLNTRDRDLGTTYDARNSLRRAGFTISDYHAEKRVMTIPDIFMHSSNIGTALMAEDVGTEALKTFYDQLGFLKPLETDLFKTARPLVPSPWSALSTVTTSYGHGIAVTPLHLSEATLKVITGGKAASLHFLEGAHKDDRATSVVTEKTADNIRRLLRLTVRVGTGRNAEVPGFLVGGKTGTAEKSAGRGYNKKALLSSFVGIYPSDKPKTLVIISIDEPKGQKDSYGYATAGWTATPAVGKVISRITAIRGELPRNPKRTYDPSEPLLRFLPENMQAKAGSGEKE